MGDTQTEQDIKHHKRDAESMGWLTESTLQPRKHRFIEGVGGRGLPEMQAQLYKLEQEAQLKKASGVSLTKPRRTAGLQLGKANAGVEERNKKDILEAPTDANQLAWSQAALERKAELYDRLTRGEADDDAEAFNVDFLTKGASGGVGSGRLPDADALMAAANVPQSRLGIGASQRTGDVSDRDQARQLGEVETERFSAAETEEEERRSRRVETVFELERETQEGRQQAAAEKQKRSQLEDRKRQALKAAMLKQLASKHRKTKGAIEGKG